MTTPIGQSYTAKLDGKEVPFIGDPGVTTVSLKRIGDSIETVSADGKSMTIEVDDKLHGTKSTDYAIKQG